MRQKKHDHDLKMKRHEQRTEARERVLAQMVHGDAVPRALRSGAVQASRQAEWGLDFKSYLENGSALRVNDFDNKAMSLLDHHFHNGTLREVLDEVKGMFETAKKRDSVRNVRAYVFALIKNFDNDVHQEWKATKQMARQSIMSQRIAELNSFTRIHSLNMRKFHIMTPNSEFEFAH